MPVFTPKGEATYVEDVIIHCINTYNKAKTEKQFVEISKKDPELVKFVKKHSKKIKISNEVEQGMKDLYVFGKTLHSKIGPPAKGGAESAGKDFPKISSWWSGKTGKNIDTSKADILIGGKQVSVKKAKAQLMSGERKESLATLEAAFAESNLEKNLQEGIIGVVDKFATRTKTEGVNTTELSKMEPSEIKSEMNQKARQVYADAQVAAGEIKTIMVDAMKNSSFQSAFAYEAMTGWEKFAGKTFNDPGDSIGYADSMLMVDDSLSKVKFEDVKSPSSPLVGKVARKMKFEVSMKSNSYAVAGKKAGYGFYQTVRLGVDTAFEESDALQESYEKEVNNIKTMLSEGWIRENKFTDMMKSAFQKLKAGLSAVFNKLKEFLGKIVEKVKETIKGGFDSIMEFFHIDYDIKADVKL
tara:strand:- start:245 stop:1483 length:1239 start_codon:yes stop_codon:yes gene_type:complete